MKTQHLLILFALLAILLENVTCGRNENTPGLDVSSLGTICHSPVEKRSVDLDAQKLSPSNDFNSPLIGFSASLMYSDDIIAEPLNGRATSNSTTALKVCVPIVLLMMVTGIAIVVYFVHEGNNQNNARHKTN